MPKVPRASDKSGRRGKGTAGSRAPSRTAKDAPRTKKDGSRNGGKRSQRSTAAKRGNSRGRKSRAATALAEPSFARRSVDQAPEHEPAGPKSRLSDDQRVLLGDLFAVVEEHSADAAEKVDKRPVQKAFVFACERHADQQRASGEEFIVHPVGVAKICAGMRLDTATLCAALLHDTVEDTSASLEEVEQGFGDEIAALVDGLTKLSGVTFQSRDDRQAENYRKMMVAMAQDIRVILIKLADRLHNMRTLGALPKQKQQEIAKETLEIFAPLAHRLGIHAIKWEL